jgi:hypothetical protein
MNTFPPSITIVSGTMTGRAAASSIRASMSTSLESIVIGPRL